MFGVTFGVFTWFFLLALYSSLTFRSNSTTLSVHTYGSAYRCPSDTRECRYLEQQLVFGDPLDGFDEEVTDGQPGLDVLLDSLEDREHQGDCQ